MPKHPVPTAAFFELRIETALFDAALLAIGTGYADKQNFVLHAGDLFDEAIKRMSGRIISIEARQTNDQSENSK